MSSILIGHHIALSVVGVDQLSENGYFRAKLAQEKIITSSGIPYTIVKATQFFEFLSSIAQSDTVGETAHLPRASFQPIASEDVATALLRVVLEKPTNGIIEIAGPERIPLSQIVEQYLKATNDPRQVIEEEDGLYFGSKVSDNALVPNKNPRLGSINLSFGFFRPFG